MVLLSFIEEFFRGCNAKRPQAIFSVITRPYSK
jgi:hypothetical protein